MNADQRQELREIHRHSVGPVEVDRDQLVSLIDALDAAEKTQAVCHCGSLVSEHHMGSGHTAVEMPIECPFGEERDDLREQNRALVEALEFYASKGSYVEIPIGGIPSIAYAIAGGDRGKIARAALQQHRASSAGGA